VSNIKIAREHQSAPKDTELDKAVKQAAEEIDRGGYIEDSPDDAAKALEGLGLSLSMGALDDVRRSVGRHGSSDEFARDVDQTRDLAQLGRHPRVLEAIEKLQAETDDGKTPDEVLEREWMLYEMTCLQVQGQKWEGQQRWEGAENEEMRLGKLMTPWDFWQALTAVIGTERVVRGETTATLAPGQKSGLVGLYVKNPRWTGAQMKREYKAGKAADLVEMAKKKTAKAEQYFNCGMMNEATKLRTEVLELMAAATQMQMEVSHLDEWVQPELLRVASLQWPLMTEWMVMHFNQYGVPTTAKYKGWRTALLTMIRSHAITEEEAHQAFPVGTGPAAAWYLEQLYRIRNPKSRAAAEMVQ
jgi:hypothetical protein